jgi:membrane dipeptidase
VIFIPRMAVCRWLLLGVLVGGACAKEPRSDSKVTMQATGSEGPHLGSEPTNPIQPQVGLPENPREGDTVSPKDPPPPAIKIPLPKAAPVLLDLHADTLHQLHRQRRRFGERTRGEVSPKAAVAGALNGQFFAVWVDPDDLNLWAVARSQLRLFDEQVVRHATFERALNPTDVRAIQARGKVAAMLSLEGASVLEGDLERFRELYVRGVRLASLTWNEDNVFATGAKTRQRHGVTPKGRQLLALMEELGVMIDVSHASEMTFWDVYTATRSPLVASHSNASSIHRHLRNLDDVQLWAIRDSGGIVGLNYHQPFLTPDRPAHSHHVVEHALHLQRVMGSQHVALGSDFDGNIRPPVELQNVGELPSLVQALKERGIRGDPLTAILGGNVLRVMGEAQARVRSNLSRYRPANLIGKPALGSRVAPLVGAEALFDRNVRTAWNRSSLSGAELQLSFRTVGQGVDRVSLCASADRPVNLRLEVYRDQQRLVRKRVVVPAGACPYRVRFPKTSCEKSLRFSLHIDNRDASGLREVLPESRRVACSLEK